MDGNHESFDDVVQRLQNKAAQEMEDALAINKGDKKKAVKGYNYEEKF